MIKATVASLDNGVYKGLSSAFFNSFVGLLRIKTLHAAAPMLCPMSHVAASHLQSLIQFIELDATTHYE